MLKIHRDVLEEFKEVGKKADLILFGSVSKGNYRLDSDMDLAIITDYKSVAKKAGRIADEILARRGRVISIKHFTRKEFEERRRKKDSLVMEILKGKVIYHGG
jgi:predicted nucleotidyltransferase